MRWIGRRRPRGDRSAERAEEEHEEGDSLAGVELLRKSKMTLTADEEAERGCKQECCTFGGDHGCTL